MKVRFFTLFKSSCVTLIAGMPLLLLLACGGSRNQSTSNAGSDVDIDKLLGNENSEAQRASEEDDVLRLLGISAATPTPEATAVLDTAESEIDLLRRQLNEKNSQVTQLRADVDDKDRLIQTLQAELEDAQRRSSRPAPIAGNYAQRYADARNLYESRKYRDAINAFAALLAEDDKNKLADNCQYWIGECYYGLGNYQQSVVEFQKVFTFTHTDKSDDSLLKLGLCYLRIGERDQARSEFEQLLANYPNSEYTGKAKLYLSKL